MSDLESNSSTKTKQQPQSDDHGNSGQLKKKRRLSTTSSVEDNSQSDSSIEPPGSPSHESDINDDGIVLSEIHINPENGRVDGNPRKTLFHVYRHPQKVNQINPDMMSTSSSSTWDYSIEIQHSMGTTLQGVGEQVWMGCFLLVDWIVSIKEQLHGCVAIELGAGTGLASIAACLLTDIDTIYCTDYDQKVLVNCKKNIDLNLHLKHYSNEKNLIIDELVLTRRCNWLLESPLDSLSSSRDEFDWCEQELEEWKKNGAFIFAADVVYDDTLTDSLVECLEKLLIEPLPKSHQYHSRGRVAYITMEKRFNFSIDQLCVVAQAVDYFVKRVGRSTIIEANRIDCSQLDQYCDYDRSKDLELFCVMLKGTASI